MKITKLTINLYKCGKKPYITMDAISSAAKREISVDGNDRKLLKRIRYADKTRVYMSDRDIPEIYVKEFSKLNQFALLVLEKYVPELEKNTTLEKSVDIIKYEDFELDVVLGSVGIMA